MTEKQDQIGLYVRLKVPIQIVPSRDGAYEKDEVSTVDLCYSIAHWTQVWFVLISFVPKKDEGLIDLSTLFVVHYSSVNKLVNEV